MQDGIPPETLTEEMLSSYMYIGGIPDPDLIIRTGGEWRLSNFLIWQAAYAEYYTTPTYWPDFDENELDKALIEYNPVSYTHLDVYKRQVSTTAWSASRPTTWACWQRL